MTNKCRTKIVQGDYIMWETLHEVGIRKKEGNTVAIRNQTCNRTSRAIYRNQSPWTLPMIFFLSVNLLSSFLCHQDLFTCRLIHWNPVFQPILYKFIVLGFLGLGPYTFWAKSSNQVLTFGIFGLLQTLTMVFFRTRQRW